MKKTIFIVLCIIIILLIIKLLLNDYDSKKALKNEEIRFKQNTEALNDSIRVYKNKNGEKSFEKLMTNMTKDELKKYNKELYDKIVKEDGEVKTIIVTKIIYVDSGNTITIMNQLDSNFYSADFNYISNDTAMTIKGRSRFYADIISDSCGKDKVRITPDTTFIDEAKTTIELTVGTKEYDDKIEVFVTPVSKNVKVAKLNGSIIYVPKKETKNKKFSINTTIGYGATLSKGIIHSGLTVNFGIGYNIFNF